MFGKMKLILIFLIIYINIEAVSSICTQGVNCPDYQGVCQFGQCVCLAGYQTFITQQVNDPIYCNYKQTSKWVPFLLELFLPSIGLFYLGRYFHAFLKLILFMPLIWSGSKVSIMWFFIFFLVYVIDLVCLFFRLYADGNGIALV